MSNGDHAAQIARLDERDQHILTTLNEIKSDVQSVRRETTNLKVKVAVLAGAVAAGVAFPISWLS